MSRRRTYYLVAGVAILGLGLLGFLLLGGGGSEGPKRIKGVNPFKDRFRDKPGQKQKSDIDKI
jgi:hypothetical protein